METISAEGFTAPNKCYGDVSFDLKGTFSGTVTIQRCPGDDDPELDVNYLDVPEGEFTAGTSKVLLSPGSYYYRAGFKTGAFTSGSAEMGFRQ